MEGISDFHVPDSSAQRFVCSKCPEVLDLRGTNGPRVNRFEAGCLESSSGILGRADFQSDGLGFVRLILSLLLGQKTSASFAERTATMIDQPVSPFAPRKSAIDRRKSITRRRSFSGRIQMLFRGAKGDNEDRPESPFAPRRVLIDRRKSITRRRSFPDTKQCLFRGANGNNDRPASVAFRSAKERLLIVESRSPGDAPSRAEYRRSFAGAKGDNEDRPVSPFAPAKGRLFRPMSNSEVRARVPVKWRVRPVPEFMRSVRKPWRRPSRPRCSTCTPWPLIPPWLTFSKKQLPGNLPRSCPVPEPRAQMNRRARDAPHVCSFERSVAKKARVRQGRLMADHLGQMTWWEPRAHRHRSARVRRSSRMLAACLLIVIPAGCMGVSVNEARLRNAVSDGWERLEANRGLNVSLETGAVLARQHLLIEAQLDPARAARLLEGRLQTQPEPDGAMALAELSYYVGVDSQTASPAASMPWYRDAAVLAMLALGDPATSRPDLAIDIHNRALTRLIRLAQNRHIRDGGNRTLAGGSRGSGPRRSKRGQISCPRTDRRPARGERPQGQGDGSRLPLGRPGRAADRATGTPTSQARRTCRTSFSRVRCASPRRPSRDPAAASREASGGETHP